MNPSTDDSVSYGFFMLKKSYFTKMYDDAAEVLMRASLRLPARAHESILEKHPELTAFLTTEDTDPDYCTLLDAYRIIMCDKDYIIHDVGREQTIHDAISNVVYLYMVYVQGSSYNKPELHRLTEYFMVDRFRSLYASTIDTKAGVLRWVEHLCANLAQRSGGDYPVHVDNCVSIKEIRKRSIPDKYYLPHMLCALCGNRLGSVGAADLMLHRESKPFNPNGSINVVEVTDSTGHKDECHTRCYMQVVWRARQNKRPCTIDPVTKSPLLLEKTVFLKSCCTIVVPKKKKNRELKVDPAHHRSAVSVDHIMKTRLRPLRRRNYK